MVFDMRQSPAKLRDFGLVGDAWARPGILNDLVVRSIIEVI
jgi:hypothetical protein